MTSRRVRRKLAKRARVRRWLTVRDVDVPRHLDRLLQRVRRQGDGVVIVSAEGRPRVVLIAPWHDTVLTSRLAVTTTQRHRARSEAQRKQAARSQNPEVEDGRL